jgi:hypothetical protein
MLMERGFKILSPLSKYEMIIGKTWYNYVIQAYCEAIKSRVLQ